MCSARMESRPLRLLCLDGGGVKGLSSLLLLREIFRALENNGRTVQPYECFDLIGGTSTGGLIAIMLGRLHMTIDEAIAAYIDISPKIFKKKSWARSPLKLAGAEIGRYWFEGNDLKNAVQELLQQRKLGADMKLQEPENPQCPVFVCAANAISTSPELLRSYNTRRIGHRNYDCFVWEAVRATSAAPLFFEPITLEVSKTTFVDGAIRANNPIEHLLSEARSLWPNREIGCVISLGTGIKLTHHLDIHKSRLHKVLQTLADIATDANNKAREFRDTLEGRELVRKKRYFRYSVPLGVGEVDIADFEKMPYMEAMTIPYLRDMDDNIEECARVLADAGQPSIGESDSFGELNSRGPIYLLPFQRNWHFTGREEELADLKKMLFADGYCPRIAITGLGGVGKTQLALQIAHEAKVAQPQCSIFWVPALSKDAWDQAYALIAKNLNLRDMQGEKTFVDCVRENLSREAGRPWLMIVDNADDISLVGSRGSSCKCYLHTLKQSRDCSCGLLTMLTANLQC